MKDTTVRRLRTNTFCLYESHIKSDIKLHKTQNGEIRTIVVRLLA